jgi:hypothetical protein
MRGKWVNVWRRHQNAFHRRPPQASTPAEPREEQQSRPIAPPAPKTTATRRSWSEALAGIIGAGGGRLILTIAAWLADH